MPTRQRFLKIILPICILLGGFLIMRAFILNRKPPLKHDKINLGALVEVKPVAKTTSRVIIHGTGTVQVAQEVTITMQVSGSVTEISPNFVAGGFFQTGELLFAVDPADYELAVQSAGASLAKATSNLSLVEGNALIAKQEWQRLHPDETPNPLVIHEPQLKAARANLAAAQAVLQQTQLNLQRTRIVAPFNCRVSSRQVGLGQYVRNGSNVAMLADTDSAEIIIPLPLHELRWLDIPAQTEQKNGPSATIQLNSDGTTRQWHGRLIRSLGEADPKGRMVRVVVRVDNPYSSINPQKQAEARADLIPGMYVEVALQGKKLSDIYVLPASALRDNSTAWIMDNDNKLRTRKINLIRREANSIWIEQGLQEGDMVITTSLVGGADGMQLRTVEVEKEEAR